MKIDVFNHIFPKKYFDKMIAVLPTERTCTNGSAMFQAS